MNEKSLEQENNFLKEMIRTYYQPEIERLNNIINEIEKEMIEIARECYGEDCINYIRKKIKGIEEK